MKEIKHDEEFNKIFWNSSEYAILLNNQGLILDVNKKALEFANTTFDNLYKKTINEIKIFSLEDLRRINQKLPEIKDGNNGILRVDAIDSKNNKHIIEFTATPILKEKNVEKIIILGREIIKKNYSKNYLNKNKKSEKNNLNTNKEKEIFTEILKDASLNDQEISNKTKIQRTTVTAIRNRILKQNIIEYKYIPKFKSLGFNIISFIFGKFPDGLSFDKNKFNGPKNVIYANVTLKNYMFVIASKDLKEYFNTLENYISIINLNKDTYIESPNVLHIPIEQVDFINLFYSKINTVDCDSNSERNKIINNNENNDNFEINENQKDIALHLINYPKDNIKDISENINVSRTTISKTLDIFSDKKILKKIAIQNKKTHNKFIVAYIYRFKISNNKDVKKIFIELQKIKGFLTVYSRFNSISIKEFTDKEEFIDNFNLENESMREILSKDIETYEFAITENSIEKIMSNFSK